MKELWEKIKTVYKKMLRIPAAAVAATLLIGITGILAYYTSSENHINAFVIGNITATVSGSGASATVRNSGNDSSFVRAYAADSYGNIADTLGSGWVYVSQSDSAVLGDYFYYTLPLASGAYTTALTNSNGNDIIVYVEAIQTCDASGNEYSGSSGWNSAWSSFLGS